LRAGAKVEEAIGRVLAATQRAVAGDPQCGNWDWDKERHALEEMCFSFVNKNDDLAAALPADLFDAWQAQLLATGETPVICRNGDSWCVEGSSCTAAADKTSNQNEQAAPRPDRKIRAIPFKAFDVTQLPQRAYLYGKHCQRGQCTATIGTDGAGKSTLGIGESIVLATGLPLLGEQPPERCRVWLHNSDDDTEEMNRRIAAFCQLHEVPMTELEGWLFVTGKDKFTVRVAANSGGGVSVDRTAVAQIAGTIRENLIDVATFDPLVSLHGVAENDPVRMNEVIQLFNGIASRENCDCSIELCHHTRKPSNMSDAGEREFDSYDARGTGSIRAATRAMRVCTV
jgi:hypothetical protein